MQVTKNEKIVQVKDAEGSVLDWMVAKCEGEGIRVEGGKVRFALSQFTPDYDLYSPSTDWGQGGQIKEREGINDFRYNKIDPNEPDSWCAHKVVPRPNMEGSTNMVALALDGPTPLIAAMRCYVSSVLGDQVEVPDELI